MAPRKILLAPLRAPEHRRFIASVFNGMPETDRHQAVQTAMTVAEQAVIDRALAED